MQQPRVHVRRRLRVRLLLLLAASLLALPGAPAFSYVLSGVTWTSESASFSINPNFPSGTGTDDEQIAAVRCAARSWRHQAESQFNFSYAGTTSEDEIDEFDATDAVFYTAEAAPGGVLAATFYAYDFSDRFVGYDIVFFGENDYGAITWSAVGDPESGELDVTAVATHEFGHALGLSHTSVSAATMYTYENGVQSRTLDDDDIDGVQAAYGFSSSADPDPAIDLVDPDAGSAAGGNEVVITGRNFTWEADTILRIDGDALDDADWDLENCETLRILDMPANSAGGAVSIEIENELGSVLLEDAYTYGEVAPQARLTSVEPGAGPLGGGTAVTVTGTGFADDAVITFGDDELLDLSVLSSTEITGVTPAAEEPGFADIRLSQSSGGALLLDGYYYSSALLAVEDTTYPPGRSGAAVKLLMTSEDPVDAFSGGVDFDGEHLDIVEVTLEGTEIEEAGFAGTTLDNGSGAAGSYWTIGVVYDFDPPLTESIEAGTDRVVAIAYYDVDDDLALGEQLAFTVESGLGTPAVELSFISGDLSVVPSAVGGKMTIAGGLFIRGDADGNGLISLADPIQLLNYMFAGGELACEDRGDIDDSGGLQIGDPIRLLNYMFSNGTEPAAPFPEEGADPTEDTLFCDE